LNLFAKINSLGNLTNTEKEIVDFINQSPIVFIEMTVEEIAERCFVSKATIYRFCKKLGYSGLNELKMMITASVSDKLVNEKNEINFNRPFKQEDSDFSVLTIMRELYEQTIYHSSTHLNMKELHFSIDELSNARNVYLFVEDSNYNIAKTFRDRMRIIGVNIEIPENDYMKLTVAHSSTKQDVAIYATNDPNFKNHLEYFKILSGNSTRIILISTSDDKVLVDRATYRLIIEPSEKITPSIANFSSNLAFSFIFDVIYSLYFKKNYSYNLETKKNLYMRQKNME